MENRRRFLACFFGVLSFANAQSPEFEVATIKPAPDVRPQRLFSVRIDKQQMTISALPLRAVIAMAYHVHPAQVLGPSWLATTAFNFTAKIPEGASVDQTSVMLRNLIIDRFKMTVHREAREQPVYLLALGNGGSKLKQEAAPAEFAFSSEGQPATVQTPMGEMKMISGGGGPEIVGSGMRLSMSDAGVRLEMSEISKLAECISADADRPVIDRTGLNGTYDIVLVLPSGGPVVPGAGPEIELFDAVEQQLGIRVRESKALIDAIVIDSMEKTPAEN